MTDILFNKPVSDNRLMYSKEFLLQYSSIKKRDPSIAEKLKPLSVTPKPKKTPKDKKWTAPNTTDKKNTLKKPVVGSVDDTSPTFQKKKNNNRNKLSNKSNPSFTPPTKENSLTSSFSSPFPTPTKCTSTSSPGNSRLTDTPVSPGTKNDDFITPVNSPLKNISSPVIQSSPVPLETPSTPNSKVQPLTPVSSPSCKAPGSPKSPFRSPPRPISPLDEQRLMQRQKQIDYGYRTVGYLRYRLLVTKEQRRPEHPRTPKKNQGCSKRSWDGQLKKWRRDLHMWDPDSTEAFRAVLDSELVLNIIKTNPELEEIVRIVKEKIDNPDNNREEDLPEFTSSRDQEEREEENEEIYSDTVVSSPRIVSDPRKTVVRTLFF